MNRSSLLQLVDAVLRFEYRKRGSPVPDPVIGEDTDIGDRGLGLDSLERINAATEVATLFHLYEAGNEDWLLAKHTVGEWIDTIVEAQQAGIRLISVASPAPAPYAARSTGQRRLTLSYDDAYRAAREAHAREASGTPCTPITRCDVPVCLDLLMAILNEELRVRDPTVTNDVR